MQICVNSECSQRRDQAKKKSSGLGRERLIIGLTRVGKVDLALLFFIVNFKVVGAFLGLEVNCFVEVVKGQED